MEIIFTLKHYNEDIVFNTHQSYEIKLLIEDYQSLQQFNADYNVGLIYQ